MRKLSVALSMAFTLVAATAISAFCANVVGEVPSPSGGPLSGVQISQMNHPVQMLAQAGSTNTSDGLLKPVAGSADPDAAAKTSDDKPKPKPTRTPVPGCKNGNAVGNKHCVPSPSE
jgi:hypothetical protein